MTDFFKAISDIIAFSITLFSIVLAVILLYANYSSRRYRNERIKKYDQKQDDHKQDYPIGSMSAAKPKTVNYGDKNEFKMKESAKYRYEFPIISEGAESERNGLLLFMSLNNLLIENPEYYDFPNSMNCNSNVFKYKRICIMGKMTCNKESYYFDDYYSDNDEADDADSKESESTYKTANEVYASLDGKNWIHIGKAPSGKLWDVFRDGMTFDVEISGGQYKYMTSENEVAYGEKPIWFYGKYN